MKYLTGFSADLHSKNTNIEKRNTHITKLLNQVMISNSCGFDLWA